MARKKMVEGPTTTTTSFFTFIWQVMDPFLGKGNEYFIQKMANKNVKETKPHGKMKGVCQI